MRASLVPILALAVVGAASAETVTIGPSQDATMIQSTAAKGSGIGDGVYAGRVGPTGGGMRRRALMAFDVAAVVPPGATIDSASLTLQLVQTTSGPNAVKLHRTLASWTEGPTDAPGGQGLPAQPGDVTWQHRTYPSLLWTVQGGEYHPTASASTVVDQNGPYTWSSSAMASDVQGWLDDPASNLGWTMVGNEAVMHTAKKFASREHDVFEWRPLLTITYTACNASDLDCDGDVDAADLAALLGAWGATASSADLDGDGTVGAGDLAILLGAWGSPG